MLYLNVCFGLKVKELNIELAYSLSQGFQMKKSLTSTWWALDISELCSRVD